MVMWVGLVVFSIVLADALDYDSETWAGVIFVFVAIIFILWMLEGRRRLKSKEDVSK
jgi:protein-S-isoprenylcysteine O-methyltransferase Ste14